MAHIISPGAEYTPYPTTAPGQPSGQMERIDATPASFGGLIGAAEQKVGGELDETSGKLFDAALYQANVYNQAAANQRYSQLQDKINNILGGDPNNPNDRGFYGLTGQAAMNARPQIMQQIRDIQNQLRSGLSTIAQNNFDADSRRLMSSMFYQINEHTNQQSKVWALSSAQSAFDSAAKNVALNYNNDDIINHNLADVDTTYAPQIGDLTGQNPALIAPKLKSQVVDQAIDRAIQNNDWQTADRIMQQHGNDLEPNVARERAQQIRAQENKADSGLWTDALLNDKPLPSVRPPSGGPTGPTANVPPAPVAPDQYKPVIDQAAAQYGVPPELLTRVLHAENGFRPTGVSSAGAQGIAQFMPATAAQYGVNPNDSNSAIPGAAHYLADLHQQRGSWHAALTGYLGGDPQNDASYTKSGAWQYADYVDRGESTTGGPTGQAPAKFDIAVGDSIGVLAQNHGVAGTSVDMATGVNKPADARVSAPTTEVLRRINDEIATDKNHFQGQTVFLSTGASNSPSNLAPVSEQIATLKANGATNIVIPGVGPGVANADQVNAQLKDIAQKNGAIFFQPDVKWQKDGVHPAESDKMLQQGLQAVAQQQPSQQQTAGPPPPATDQLTPTPQPVPGATTASTQPQQIPNSIRDNMPPPVAAANGLTGFAQAQEAIADKYSRAIDRLNASGLQGADPAKYKSITEGLKEWYTSQNQGITSHAKVFQEQANKDFSDFTSEIIGGNVKPDIIPRISANTFLTGEQKENLVKFMQQQNEGDMQGDPLKYGSGAADAFHRILARDDDPDKIRYPQQVLDMANQRDADGKPLLTKSSVANLLETLDRQQKDMAGASYNKQIDGAIRYAENKIAPSLLMGKGLEDSEESARFNNGFLPAFHDYLENEMRQQHAKPMKDILSKENIDAVMAPFKPTDAQQMLTMHRTIANIASQALPNRLNLPPRMPNETADQYLSRIGGGTPTPPAAEPSAPFMPQ